MKRLLPFLLFLAPLAWGGQMQTVTDKYDNNDVSAINRNFSKLEQQIYGIKRISGNLDIANSLTVTRRIGVGTTAPSMKAHFIGTTGFPASSGTSQNGTLRLQVEGYSTTLDFGAEGPTTGKQWLQVTDSGNLGITYPLLLNPNGGNVGIGTTDPTDRLTVFTGSVSTQIAIGYDSTAYYAIGRDNSTGYLRFNGMQGTSYSGFVFSINGVNYLEYAGPTDVAWFRGNVSALSFTDRTPYPKDKQEAYASVLSIKAKGNGVDHDSLNPFILNKTTSTVWNKTRRKYEKVILSSRNLSATVSAQNEVIKDLIKRIEVLESK